MKFIDEVIIKIKAGKGGNGCISFYKKKNNKKIPDGGNGGNGGNIWLVTDKKLNTLKKYNLKKKNKKINGKRGKKKNCSGKNGEDIFIKIPINTKITDLKKKKTIKYIIKDKKYLLIAKGGKHGLGNKNYKLKNHKNIKNKIKGKKGENIKIKLKLLIKTDVGIIGLPNSGKSTLINAISSNKFKTNNYPFTTIIPNLATVYSKNKKKFMITDIPGLIKGASYGKGLGIQFLKYIKNCKILLHIVDIKPENKKKPLTNIINLINEIKNYDKKLINKPHWVIFNKIDKIKKNKKLKKKH